MARLRFGDQSIPRVTRVATGGGGGNVGALADVDLTDTRPGGLQDGSVLVYKQSIIQVHTDNSIKQHND